MTEDRFALLAERHRKVLRLYAQRYRLKEIGRLLSLSENSVNTYLTEAVHILGEAGRRAAAEALTQFEGPSQYPTYPSSVPDERNEEEVAEKTQSAADQDRNPRQLMPLRPRTGMPNGLSIPARLFSMVAMLIALVVGIAVAVAVYTVYVKPMEHLLH